jgi:hypothetical protein
LRHPSRSPACLLRCGRSRSLAIFHLGHHRCDRDQQQHQAGHTHTYRDDTLIDSFRIAEDATFADSSENALQIADAAIVGIAHPLSLGADAVATWGEVLADYELLQPFPQIGRPLPHGRSLNLAISPGTIDGLFAGFVEPLGSGPRRKCDQ